MSFYILEISNAVNMLNKILILIISLSCNYCFAISLDFTDSKDKILPEGFVYLSDIDPTIIVDLKYSTDQNFMASPVRGYNSPKAILTLEAATALKAVQNDLRLKGYSLVVYDAYRPRKAVEQFVEWTANKKDQKNKIKFYPNVLKSELVNLGYIAEDSDHSRGSSVDVSIIRIDQDLSPINEIKRVLNDGTEILFLDDGTLDMGSSYDLFDEVSAHNCPKNSALGDINRRFLKTIMYQHGFKAYDKEWWHYTYIREPFADTSFDFDIE